MNLQPTLKGRLVTLRPLNTDDFEELFKVSSDPLIWEQHPSNDRHKKDVFEKFFEAAIESKGAFAVIDNADEKIIGSSRYYDLGIDDLDREKKKINIGYTFLAKKYWGKHYNEEMKDLMLSHAFSFVDTVYFQVGDQNTRSQLAMKKIGAILCGKETLDNSAHVVFKIDKADWKRSLPRFKVKK